MTTDCPIFSLPAELRAEIYSYTFAAPQTVHLADALSAVPSSALLTTCREIHEEAEPLYKYWQTTIFTAERTTKPLRTTKFCVKKALNGNWNALPWHLIHHLLLGEGQAALKYDSGSWRLTCQRYPDITRLLFVRGAQCDAVGDIGMLKCSLGRSGRGRSRTCDVAFFSSVTDEEVEGWRKRLHPGFGLIEGELKAMLSWMA